MHHGGRIVDVAENPRRHDGIELVTGERKALDPTEQKTLSGLWKSPTGDLNHPPRAVDPPYRPSQAVELGTQPAGSHPNIESCTWTPAKEGDNNPHA